MARATKKAAPAAQDDPELALIGGAMALAAEEGWRDVTVRRAALAGGVAPGTAVRLAASRDALLALLLARMTEAAADRSESPDPETPARDRVFDVAMLGFEWLEPYREGLAEAVAELRRDPLSALSLRGAVERAVKALLELAGVSNAGLRGFVSGAGLTGVWLQTLDAFVSDEPGLPRTMATLDRGLRRGEMVMARWPFARKHTPASES